MNAGPQRAPEPSERTMLANGLRHHVLTWEPRREDDAAPAETVVLCHGFLDQAWSFAPLAALLVAEGYRVVAFDWRGHGATQHIGAGGYYHFFDYALDLHELMPLLSSGVTHLLGHSMGGSAVALYAGTHPGVAKTVTLVEGLGPPESGLDDAAKMLSWLESVDRVRAKTPRPIKDLAEAVKRLRVPNPELPVELAYLLAEKGTRPVEGGLAWSFDPLHRTTSPRAFSAANFMTFLARIEAPTLLVQGEKGFRTADHETRREALPDWREETIPSVGHMIHWLAPDALAHLVVSHLRS